MDDPHLRDFDFFMGCWRVQHRRLKERLTACTDWQEFDGVSTVRPILDGQGNIDDNVLNLPGETYRAASIRTFEPGTKRWAIWWLDARDPHSLGTPVVGSFERGVGTFYAEETIDGRPITVRFLWTQTDTPTPRWEQAFSADGRGTWETNWIMDFTRAE